MLNDILNRIADFIEIINSVFSDEIWPRIKRSGRKIKRTYRTNKKRYIRGISILAIILAFSMVLVLIGLLFKTRLFLIPGAFLASISFLLFYFAFLFPVKFFGLLTDNSLGFRKIGKSIAESVQYSLFPILGLSFFFASGASYFSIRGFEGITLGYLGVWGLFLMVLILFALLTPPRTLGPHITVLIVVIMNMFAYLWPIPSQQFVVGFEKTINSLGIGNNDQIVTIEKDAPQFKYESGKFIENGTFGEAEQEAKVIDAQEDYETGDIFFKVVLYKNKVPRNDGKERWVSENTIIKERMNTSSPNKEESTSNTKNTSDTKSSPRKILEDSVYFSGNDTVWAKIKMYPGDLVEYIDPSSTFKQVGLNQDYYISKYRPQDATSEGYPRIIACGKKGHVIVRITPQELRKDI